MVGHHLGQVWVFSQVASVFHGAHARLDAHAQSGTAHGMAHGVFFLRPGFIDQGFDFVGAESDVFGAMTGAGAGASGGGEFDHVSADPHQLADQGAYGLRTVGHAVGVHRVGDEHVSVSGRCNPVADAAGWRDDGHGG